MISNLVHSDTAKLSNQVLKLVLGMVAVLWLIVMVVVILSGFQVSYDNKQKELVRLAKILAHSAETNQANLLAFQVSESMRQDDTIEDILFYSVSSAFDSTQRQQDWYAPFVAKMVSIHEDVKATGYLGTESDLGANPMLLGYINITLDVQALRLQWLWQQRWVLFGITMLFFVLMLAIYWRLQRLFVPLEKMTANASMLIEQEGYEGIIRASEVERFYETQIISDLISKLETAYVKLDTDMQELRVQTVQLSQRQTDGLASSFQSMIVHEIKTSLEVIFGGMHLIDKRYLSNEHSEAFGVIEQGVTQLNATLNQIVQFSRIERGQVGVSLSELHPVQLINELIEEFQNDAKQKRLQLVTNIAHVDHLLAGDVKKIHTILSALLNNAIKYTPSGKVSIVSKMDYFTQTVRWTVQVADTGVGIKANFLEDIFLPFFQIQNDANKQQIGAGIGLSMAKKLTELLGGELTVESVESEGSVFTMVLQLQDWKQVEKQNLLNGINIVTFLETATVNYTPFSEVLEQHGANVQVFDKTQRVITHIENKPSDILLLPNDMSMSHVQNICTQIRETETSHRIIIAWLRIKPIHKRRFSDLQALGLDYTLDATDSIGKQIRTVRSWINGSQ